MKKLTAVILSLVLIFSLTACASETDENLEKARTLMEAGDYEGAERVIAADPSYLQFSAMMDQIRRHEIEFLLGTWVALDGEVAYDFHDDYTVTVDYAYGDPERIDYTYDKGRLNIYGLIFDLTEEDGVLYLGKPGTPGAMVQKDQRDSVVKTVELTPDNWEDYFEYREQLLIPDVDEDGTIEKMWIQDALVLREEYVDAFVYSTASFEIATFGSAWYDTDWRPNRDENMEFSMTRRNSISNQEDVTYCSVVDRRMPGFESDLSQLSGMIAADFYMGDVTGEGEVWLKENPRLTDVTGNLILRR